MSIQRSTYSPNALIQPFLMSVRKAVDSDFIIIDDNPPNRAAQVTSTIDKDIAWIKVEADYRLTVLAAAPTNVTPVSPDFTNWHQSKILIKGGEVFIAEYPSTALDDTNRTSLTGYQFGTLDAVFIMIDRRLNTITICQTQQTV